MGRQTVPTSAVPSEASWPESHTREVGRRSSGTPEWWQSQAPSRLCALAPALELPPTEEGRDEGPGRSETVRPRPRVRDRAVTEASDPRGAVGLQRGLVRGDESVEVARRRPEPAVVVVAEV